MTMAQVVHQTENVETIEPKTIAAARKRFTAMLQALSGGSPDHKDVEALRRTLEFIFKITDSAFGDLLLRGMAHIRSQKIADLKPCVARLQEEEPVRERIQRLALRDWDLRSCVVVYTNPQEWDENAQAIVKKLARWSPDVRSAPESPKVALPPRTAVTRKKRNVGTTKTASPTRTLTVANGKSLPAAPTSNGLPKTAILNGNGSQNGNGNTHPVSGSTTKAGTNGTVCQSHSAASHRLTQTISSVDKSSVEKCSARLKFMKWWFEPMLSRMHYDQLSAIHLLSHRSRIDFDRLKSWVDGFDNLSSDELDRIRHSRSDGAVYADSFDA